jgi:hypothetical protein
MAFSLTPTGGKKVIGAATMQGATWVDNDTHTVYISGAFIKDTYFPSLDSATSAQMAQFRPLISTTLLQLTTLHGQRRL